jgi:glutamate-5-semialdehyde dehydrogenase
MTDSIDLVIPRGSNALVSSIQNSTRIPVMGHADGLCCVYIHADADVAIATRVILDSKTDYPAACNAAETLLVHSSLVASEKIRPVLQALLDHNVKLHCSPDILSTLQLSHPLAGPATPTDVTTEFLDLELYVTTTPSLDAAINHVNTYSSHHTDAIVTTSASAAAEFQRRVDSAGVYWNASTRYGHIFVR